jgi:hypothetical protein
VRSQKLPDVVDAGDASHRRRGADQAGSRANAMTGLP